jgi:citrate lyase subunit beta/citryl-CoA lyase
MTSAPDIVRSVRARRACLVVPGSEPRFHAKADEIAVDQIVFDLEDGVAPAAKAEARAAVVKALRTFAYAGKTKVVRVNAPDTEWYAEDLIAIVGEAGDTVDCLVIPKAEFVEEVRGIDDALTQLERKHGLERRIGLELQIESARGMDRVSEIAAASSRTETLVFGPGDLAASLRMPELTIGGVKDYPGDFWHFFVARLVVAARAYGLQPIDGPYGDIKDEKGLRESARRSAMLGCDGKWSIHPSQVGPITDAFTPAQADIDRAATILAAYGHATARRTGAALVGGEMIDEASRKMAEVVMERAALFGLAPKTR